MAKSHDILLQVLPSTSKGQTCWHMVHSQDQRPSCQSPVQRGSACVHGHHILGKHSAPDCDWHTQARQPVHQPNHQSLSPGGCSQEHNDVIIQYSKREGDRLFQQAFKWPGDCQLQQDNAPAHETAQNMALIASRSFSAVASRLS